jgi:FkbM family methyltransferase
VIRGAVNAALRTVGLRLVSAGWGPTGFAAALTKLKARGWSPQQVIDVGAWTGTWTAECMTIFPDARYLLIDPLPANRAALTAFCASHPNATIWSGAAGAADGTLRLYEHADQSSAFRASIPDWRGEPVTVEMRTLDSFLDGGEMAPPQLIKADVQGYELEVLRGGSQALATAEAVLLEVSFRELYEGQPLAHEVIGYLGERDFVVADICSYSQAADGRLLQSDLLFVRRDQF